MSAGEIVLAKISLVEEIFMKRVIHHDPHMESSMTFLIDRIKDRHVLGVIVVMVSLMLLIGCTEGPRVPETSTISGSQPSQTVTGNKLPVVAVTVSNSGGGNVAPKNAIDRDVTTQWSSGAVPPQWIQLDLGAEVDISKVRLNVSQTPPGPTTHQIYGGATPDQMLLISTLDGVTNDGQWLEVNTPAKKVRYIKITSTKSPSWIAWREIEVYQ